MKHQHPALARAAALQARFYGHALQATAPITDPVTDPEWESTPATQLEVEMLFAEQEYLELEDFLRQNPRADYGAALGRVTTLYANWSALRAQLENQE